MIELFIINRHDKPCWDLVVMKTSNGEGRYVFNRDNRPQEFSKRLMEEATPLIEFGIHCDYESDGFLYSKEEPSKARYEDGQLRQWQDTDLCLIEWNEFIEGTPFEFDRNGRLNKEN